MKGLQNKKLIILFLIAVSFCLVFTSSAFAGYSVNFATDKIQIINPPNNGTEVHGVLPISGTAKVDEVWFCIRGPQDEVEVQKAQVTEGEFSIQVTLRFGPGLYTIWAADNKTSFDGKIRFTANNVIEDNRYISASNYVNSDDPAIIELSSNLVNDDMTDMEKAKAIHDWVAGNIEYDYQAYLEGDLGLKTASATLQDGSALCSGYSFLYAALSRAAGLTAKVVYGQIKSSQGWEAQKHAWNEVMINGKWINVDSTWDAGYIKDGSFVASLSNDYFNPAAAVFASTHSDGEDKFY